MLKRQHILILLVTVILAILGMTLLVDRRTGTVTTITNEQKKRRIRSFWEAYNLATYLRSRGKFEQAAKNYERALQLDPRHEESLYYLGSCLLELGEYEHALRSYEQLISIDPQSNRGQSQLGILLSTPVPGAVLDLAKARQMFERVSKVNREESGPFLRLGQLDLLEQKLEEAFFHFQTAAGFKSPEGLFFAGFVRFQQGKYEEAASFFQKVLEINRREKEISGRGVFSEGDISHGKGNSLSLLEKAGVRALVFLHWTAEKLGGYPAGVPPEFRVHIRQAGRKLSVSKLPVPGNAAWCDWDGDGDPDTAVVDEKGSTTIFRNQRGTMLRQAIFSKNLGWDALWGDYNGDQRPDLYIISNGYTGTGQNQLYRNEGEGKFTEVTVETGLIGQRATAAAVLVDLDGDADLDLIEAGNSTKTAAPLRIFRNQEGRFQSHAIPFPGNAVALAAGDYNRDGAPDLFVLRWKRQALLLRNNGKGDFTNATEEVGLQQLGGNSYSAVFFDFNRDSWPDLFVSHWATYETALECYLWPKTQRAEESPRLFLNEQGTRFKEVSMQVELRHAYGTMRAVLTDIDGDGWTDILLANGGPEPWRIEPSVVLRNLEGKTFMEWRQTPAAKLFP